jgi:pimeloyl-ACP methyl ester carboxylesterase
MVNKSANIIEEYKKSLHKLFEIEGISPISKYIETNGPVKRIHYIEAGKGEPLILIHGGGGNNSHWYNLIKPLQEKFRLFVIDRPGCGLTEAFNYRGVDMIKHPVEFIKSFMDAIGINKTSFLSNSMGGYFTVRFALEFPERINKIILIGAPAGLDNNTPFLMRLFGIKGLNSFFTSIIVKPSLNGIKTAFKQIITPNADRLPEELFECCYLGGLLPGAEQSWKTLLERVITLKGKGFNKQFDITEVVTRIQNPILFVWGDKDKFAPPSVGETAVHQMKNATIKIIENAGHQLWWDDPLMCSELIIDFLNN